MRWHDKVGPAMLFLPSRPSKKEWSDIVAATKNGFGLTGTVATGGIGPTMGLVDIGECEDAYLFRLSLPGVKRNERKFLVQRISVNCKGFIYNIIAIHLVQILRF